MESPQFLTNTNLIDHQGPSTVFRMPSAVVSHSQEEVALPSPKQKLKNLKHRSLPDVEILQDHLSAGAVESVTKNSTNRRGAKFGENNVGKNVGKHAPVNNKLFNTAIQQTNTLDNNAKKDRSSGPQHKIQSGKVCVIFSILCLMYGICEAGLFSAATVDR